jgi:hypothetical protein
MTGNLSMSRMQEKMEKPKLQSQSTGASDHSIVRNVKDALNLIDVGM